MSSYSLSEEENDVLSTGLNYGIEPLKLRKTDVFYSFELVSRFMRESLRDKKDDAHVRSTLSQIANSDVVSYKPSKSALKKHGILKKLKNNSDIVIVKPDKGNAVVILDRSSYDECLLKILNDTSKFKVLTEDPTFYREGQLQRRLLKLKKRKVFLRTKHTGAFILVVPNLPEFTGCLKCTKRILICLLFARSFHLSEHLITIWLNI